MESKRVSTVGRYLIQRLGEVGIKHVFGVPGDYILSFFDYLESSDIEAIYNTNELNAGYAADAYARLNGISAVCVTYAVGGFGLFNAVAGAFAEDVPLIVISGGPSTTKRKKKFALQHVIEPWGSQKEIYKNVTVISTILSLEKAPEQIDEAIRSCIQHKKPVYIEIPEDIVSKRVKSPTTFKVRTKLKSDGKTLQKAVSISGDEIVRAGNPLILVGVEIHRFNLQKKVEKLLSRTGYLFAVTPLAKSVLSEQHPQFVGVYAGKYGSPIANKIVEESDFIIGLGTIGTDIDTGIKTTKFITIDAHGSMVRIKEDFYFNITLKDFIDGLILNLPKGRIKGKFERFIEKPDEEVEIKKDREIIVDRFYNILNNFINEDHIIVADTANSLFNALQLYLPKNVQFIGQAFYLSIGFSIPATLGAGLAIPEKRVILFVNKESFQANIQVLSSLTRHRLNSIIFLLNSNDYASLYKGQKRLQKNQYYKLHEVFQDSNGWSCLVKTEGDLMFALSEISNRKKELILIEVQLRGGEDSEQDQKVETLESKEQ